MAHDAHDAVLVLSFGGPDGPDDVLPFLRNVTRGRDVPEERLATVAEQYLQLGGRSPINDQCRALVAALRRELDSHQIDLPVYWGNRNWHPFVTDTVARMAADGIGHALVFVTSAFGSYPGCRQYREDLDRATVQAGPDAPRLSKLRLYYNHPGFIEPIADHLRAAAGHASGRRPPPRVVFTAHSLPLALAAGCDYVDQLHHAAELVMHHAGLAGHRHDLVYQSRSGPPSVPWLEPDVNDHLLALGAGGVRQAVLVPIGFVSDHAEILFDLDIQAAATAAKTGIDLIRVPTVGTQPRFVAMIRELIEERCHGRPRLHLGEDGPWPDACPADHCPPPPAAARRGNERPQQRRARIGGED